ncbi:MAG: hypothetical protein GX256_00725 [Fretibacterium sp.]|nr:hypothetical protein [Fretibacterium sp.]
MNRIQKYNFRIQTTEVPPELHKTEEAQQLKEACQQFESILWAQIWKKMRDSARKIGGTEHRRPWKQMEDLSLEMASDSLAASGGVGLWKLLYDQVAVGLATEQSSAKLKQSWSEKNEMAKVEGENPPKMRRDDVARS